MIKLTEEEKLHVQESIVHWENDIIKEFDDGKVTVMLGGTPRWADKRLDGILQVLDKVKCYAEYCPLCSRYFDEDDCIICPIVKIYGMSCEVHGSEWQTFEASPTKENAIKMLNSLKELMNR